MLLGTCCPGAHKSTSSPAHGSLGRAPAASIAVICPTKGYLCWRLISKTPWQGPGSAPGMQRMTGDTIPLLEELWELWQNPQNSSPASELGLPKFVETFLGPLQCECTKVTLPSLTHFMLLQSGSSVPVPWRDDKYSQRALGLLNEGIKSSLSHPAHRVTLRSGTRQEEHFKHSLGPTLSLRKCCMQNVINHSFC